MCPSRDRRGTRRPNRTAARRDPSPDIDGQTRAAFANLIAVLAAGGASESDVVHVRIYLTDEANIGVVNDAFEATFSQPYPARTAVYVGLRAGVLVEVDALAVVD